MVLVCKQSVHSIKPPTGTSQLDSIRCNLLVILCLRARWCSGEGSRQTECLGGSAGPLQGGGVQAWQKLFDLHVLCIM